MHVKYKIDNVSHAVIAVGRSGIAAQTVGCRSLPEMTRRTSVLGTWKSLLAKGKQIASDIQ